MKCDDYLPGSAQVGRRAREQWRWRPACPGLRGRLAQSVRVPRSAGRSHPRTTPSASRAPPTSSLTLTPPTSHGADTWLRAGPAGGTQFPDRL